MRQALLMPLLALAPLAALAQGAPPVWIFGEQHDQPDQQAQVAAEVARLAARGELAAVVLEMADRGRSTAGLAADASAEQARQALVWTGWPWEPYAAVVMNAVRAGVPVWGGNLPRSENRARMADASLEALVSAPVREQLAQAVRDGHCGLLPASQEPGMVRIQLARDQSLAATVAERQRAARAGQTVLLLTGAQHASRDRGVPLHLVAAGVPEAAVKVTFFGDASAAAGLRADEQRAAVFTPRPDPCEGLAEKLRKP